MQHFFYIMSVGTERTTAIQNERECEHFLQKGFLKFQVSPYNERKLKKRLEKNIYG